MLLFFFIYQTEKLASLMNKYWSLELFWFPFNSFLSGILNIFRDENEHELIIPPTLFFAADHLEHVSHIWILPV